MFRALPILLIGLATPLLAQEPGLGIEGEGTQTQSIELLQDSVSVTLESSGSLSLGRGNDSVGGGVSLSVNDLTIIGVSRDGNNSANEATSGGAAPQLGNTPGGPSGAGGAAAAQEVVVHSATPGASGASGSTVCAPSDGEREQLVGALTSGQEIWMRPITCTTAVAEDDDLAMQYPQLVEAVTAAGRSFEEVVAITISEDFVILDMMQAN